MPRTIASPERQWKRVRSPFDLPRLQRFYDASVDATGPLTITTTGKPWHYAVAIPYQLPWYDRSCRGTELAVVRVRATVLRGQISIGLTDDRQEFLDQTIRSAGDEDQSFDLLVGNLSEARWLVVRDGPEPGGQSQVVVDQVNVFRIPPLTLDSELSAPKGVELLPMPGWSRFYGALFNEFPEKERNLRYKQLIEPMPMRWLDGLQVYIYPNNEISRTLYVSGLYEPTDAVVLRRLLPRGGTFFDLGANIGIFSLLAARRIGPAGKVYAFEPSTRDFDRLLENLHLNGLSNIVRANRLAIADRDGVTELHVAGDAHSGHNTLGDGFVYSEVAEAAVEWVPITTLDSYVRREAIQRLDVIKMDIEGSEGRVLKGARAVLHDLRPRIVFEMNDAALQRNGSSAAQVLEALAGLGYSLWAIDDATAALRPLTGQPISAGGNFVALPNGDEVPEDES